VHRRRVGEDDLRGDLNDPRRAQRRSVVIPAVVAISHVLRHSQLRVPVAARLDIGLELGVAVDARVVILPVRVEGGGVRGDVDGVRPVEVGGAQRDGRRISYAHVEEGGRGQDAVFRGRVCYCIAACAS